MNNIAQPSVHELTGPEASKEWDAWAETIPGHLYSEFELVPLEKDQFSQRLDRAGFSSRQNDPTLRGVK